jgi:hypothetical protein
MTTRRLLMMLAAFAGMLLCSYRAQADTYIKQVEHTDSMEVMGQKQPERFDTTVMWLNNKWARSDMGDTATTLFDAEKGELYMLNHVSKTYSVFPLDFSAMTDSAMAGANPGDSSSAQAMMNSMMKSIKCTVTPTDETKKIGNWNAHKYTVDMSIMMMNMTSETWATEDVDVDMQAFYALSEGMLARIPGASKIMSEMMKVKGVPVLITTTGNVMGAQFKSTKQIVECVTRDAPPDAYKVPEGYQKIEPKGMHGL